MVAGVTGTHRWLHCALERGWGLETGTCSATTRYMLGKDKGWIFNMLMKTSSMGEESSANMQLYALYG